MATALTILSLTNMNFDLAVSWLTDPHRRGLRLAPDITGDRVQRVLEDCMSICTPEEIASWGFRSDALSPASFRTAHTVVAKANLTAKVAAANNAHGVAPSSRSLLVKYNLAMRGLQATGVFDPWVHPEVGVSGDMSGRRWMSWWRQKFGVKFGAMRFGDPVSMEEKRLKVGTRSPSPSIRFLGPLSGPGGHFLGGVFWAFFWARA